MNKNHQKSVRMGANGSRILVALDGLTIREATQIALELHGHVAGIKANDLIEQGGASVLRDMKANIRFLDPKIADIAATVGNRVEAYINNANLVTVHSSISNQALAKATEVAHGTTLGIIAVTVLTDIESEECFSIFGTADVEKMVVDLADRALTLGVNGIVCSPHEAALVRKLSKEALIITPGVRSKGASNNDQKRVMTPYEAILNGANLLVCGRQILSKETFAGRQAEASLINEEVNAALTELRRQ